jgi:hypothetical protein
MCIVYQARSRGARVVKLQRQSRTLRRCSTQNPSLSRARLPKVKEGKPTFSKVRGPPPTRSIYRSMQITAAADCDACVVNDCRACSTFQQKEEKTTLPGKEWESQAARTARHRRRRDHALDRAHRRGALVAMMYSTYQTG